MPTVHTGHPTPAAPPEPPAPTDPFSSPGKPLTWRRGLIEPNRAHIQETEDGEPRTIPTNGGRAAIAICQAWLTGHPLTPDQFSRTSVRRCTVCDDYCNQLPAIPQPQGEPDAT